MFLEEVRVLESPLQLKCYLDCDRLRHHHRARKRRRRKKEEKVEEWNLGSEYFSNIDGAIVVFLGYRGRQGREIWRGQATERREG